MNDPRVLMARRYTSWSELIDHVRQLAAEDEIREMTKTVKVEDVIRKKG